MIAIVATLNGIIVQMVMSSRVIYGLADRGLLPDALAKVSATTRTPQLATAIVVGLVLLIAISLPLDALAEWTSRLSLAIFALINAALVLIKRRSDAVPAFVVPSWVPVLGFVLCLALLAADLIGRA